LFVRTAWIEFHALIPSQRAFAGQWFATDVGDKKIVRLLKLPGAAAQAEQLGEPKLTRYKVVVKTSDVKGAGR
jgi:hypothetical protein